MSDILTREEYAAIAADMTFPANSWINGKFTSAKTGETYDTINPATGDVLAQVASLRPELGSSWRGSTAGCRHRWHSVSAPQTSSKHRATNILAQATSLGPELL